MRTFVLPVILLCLVAGAPAALSQELLLKEQDLISLGKLGWMAPSAVPPATNLALPMVNPKANDKAANILRGLATWRRAAGFAGVVYDNRDRGHSTLPDDAFPALARLEYAPELKKAGLDYGLGGAILLPAIVFGNSSTAFRDGPLARSLGRFAMTSDTWPERSFRSYSFNQIYVYPEHRDHDVLDLYPANWPYMVISQGSSGSDQPFLRAIAMALAAMRPDARARLQQENLIAPTLQMLLRRSQTQVVAPEDYFTGVAHPTVFDGKALLADRMVSLAAALRAETIPPMVLLDVLDEDFLPAAGLGGLSERLFDTPSAVARVWRGPSWRHVMTVSAAATHDPNGRALTFRWVLLRGDPGRVTITPQGPEGATARIIVDWQEISPVGPGSVDSDGTGQPRLTSRVDVGVFASNGFEDSAPAFVSVSFPTQEMRRYTPGPDGMMRLAEVNYDAEARGSDYDPLVHWTAPWHDTAIYDLEGTLTGWRRDSAAGAETFDAAGRRADGTLPVYRIDRLDGGRRSVLTVVPQDGTQGATPAPNP